MRSGDGSPETQFLFWIMFIGAFLLKIFFKIKFEKMSEIKQNTIIALIILAVVIFYIIIVK